MAELTPETELEIAESCYEYPELGLTEDSSPKEARRVWREAQRESEKLDARAGKFADRWRAAFDRLSRLEQVFVGL
jgi:hypothetical protein